MVFEHNLIAEPARQPIWPWLLLVAAVLLPVDVALRRLVLTREDWQRAWAATGGRVWARMERRPTADSRRPQTERVARLFAAKERAGRPTADGRPPTADDQSPAADEGRPGASGMERPPIGEEPASGEELASRLLERKRRRHTKE